MDGEAKCIRGKVGHLGRGGFTLVELMVVIAIIAILALIALPNTQDAFVREQVVEAMKLADVAKAPVAAGWLLAQSLPVDNAAAGLPVPEKIVSNTVQSVAVEQGAVHVTFGNNANPLIRGKTLTLRPAVVEDAAVVPVAWVCAGAKVPGKMSVKGLDRSNLPKGYLPRNCR